ncbi:MAG: insulinase family protein [Cyanobacteria bacterium Co-bin8]|nr:insulinase family protein [Cyanobacteria bacterium Co-bin8]
MPISTAFAAPIAGLVAPTIRQLPNGLTIIAEQMPIEAINLSIWLRVGSAIESDPINGMAHFLEHMIFKGTPALQSGEFERLIEGRGAVTNAATSQDYTHYYITAAPKDFAALAPLQIQMVLNPRLADEDFERERPVILEEIRQAEDNPRRRTFYRSMEMAFDRLPYRRPVLGPAAVIEQLQPQQMRDFHRTWYQPRSMTAVAVGNLPVDTLIEVVAEAFEQAQLERSGHDWAIASGLSLKQFETWTVPKPEAPFECIRRADYVDGSLQQARLIMSWRVPGLRDLEETYALDILASILGQGRTSRLVRDLREERGLVSSISASNMTYGQQGVFNVSAQVPVENLEVVEDAIAHHIAAICNTPITESELSRVRTQVANRYVFGSETPSDRAGLYGYYHTLTGDVGYALDYPAKIQGLEATYIQLAAQQYLIPDAYGLVTLRPA